MPKPAKGGFYAVMEGRKPGVYLTWEECEAQVKGYPNSKYKKFTNAAEAEGFVKGLAVPVPSTSNNSEKPNKTYNGPASTYDKGKKRAMSPGVQDESGWDVVYSDGACKGNGKADPLAGVGVWWGVDDPRNIAERCPGDQTNNRAELIAILRILETTPRTKKPLLIKSDSQYSIKCFRDWLPGWQKNGWKTSGGEPVKNGDIIRYLSAHLDARARFGQKIRLQYVKGHSGDQGNDGADAQANLGALLPVQSERDWKNLKRDLMKRVEEEWQSKKVKPPEAPMEIEGAIVELPTESPMKVRRTGREIPSQQPPQVTSKPLEAAVLPTPITVTTGRSPNLSTPESVESPRNMSSFKPAGRVAPSPQGHDAASGAESKRADLPTPVMTTSTPKQIKQTTTLLSTSKHSQESKAPPPKALSRISQAVPSHQTKSLRNPSTSLTAGTTGFSTSPLRDVYMEATREYPSTPPGPTKSARVQATPTLTAEAHTPGHTPAGHTGTPSVIVNKEDIDFMIFEDCAIDDEDMWKDLWP